MTPEITLIAGTAVDWHRFVTTVNNAIGRSPTRELDTFDLPVGNPLSYAAALAEFMNPKSNPITAIREAERVYAHLTFTFFVSVDAPTSLAFLKQGIGLSVLAAEPAKGRENYIVSANFRDWRIAIVEGCSPSVQIEARIFYNAIWSAFDRLGFREAFTKFIRHELRDATFSLEMKT